MDRAAVHVVALVRGEPHEVRCRRRGSKVGEQGRIRADGWPGGDDPGATRRIARDVAVIHEGIVVDDVVPAVGGVAAARHVFHVTLPRQPGGLEAVHDVRRPPRGLRARRRVRSGVRRAAEVRPARQAQIVGKARVRVAVHVLRRDSIGTGETGHVRGGSTAARQDVADVVVLHDDDEDVVEVCPLRGGPGEGGRCGRRPPRWGRRRDADGQEEEGDEDCPHHRVHSPPPSGALVFRL